MIIKKYPLDSKMGPMESCTTLYAYMLRKVAIKNTEYAPITMGLRYYLITESYFLSADFLSTICDMLLMNTPAIRIREWISIALFMLLLPCKQQYPGEDYQGTDDVIPFKVLMEDQDSPEHSPEYTYCPVGICKSKRKSLYDLLPQNRINTQDKEIKAKEQYVAKAQELML